MIPPIVLNFNINEPQQIFEQFKLKIQSKNTVRSDYFQVNPELGEGFGRMFEIESDLFLNYFSTTFNRELIAIRNEDLTSKFHQIVFWFSESDAELLISNKKMVIGKRTTAGVLFGSPKLQGLLNVKPKHKSLNISLTFSEDWLARNTPENINNFIQENPNYFIQEHISFDTDLLINQLENIEHTSDLLSVKAVAYKLLGTFFSKLTKHKNEIKTELNSDDLKKIFFAVGLIESNIESTPTVEDLTKQVGMSESSFTLKFKKIFNTTVYKYIQQKKIERAIEYLKFSDLSISEVGNKVGYSNLGNFSKVFKNYTGTLPSEYTRK